MSATCGATQNTAAQQAIVELQRYTTHSKHEPAYAIHIVWSTHSLQASRGRPLVHKRHPRATQHMSHMW